MAHTIVYKVEGFGDTKTAIIPPGTQNCFSRNFSPANLKLQMNSQKDLKNKTKTK